MPAQAGIQENSALAYSYTAWSLAFAGMTFPWISIKISRLTTRGSINRSRGLKPPVLFSGLSWMRPKEQLQFLPEAFHQNSRGHQLIQRVATIPPEIFHQNSRGHQLIHG
jgi:hypothetical protein